MPTARRAVADLISVALGIAPLSFRKLNIYPDSAPPAKVLPPEQVRSRYYLRLTVKDEPGVMGQVSADSGGTQDQPVGHPPARNRRRPSRSGRAGGDHHAPGRRRPDAREPQGDRRAGDGDRADGLPAGDRPAEGICGGVEVNVAAASSCSGVRRISSQTRCRCHDRDIARSEFEPSSPSSKPGLYRLLRSYLKISAKNSFIASHERLSAFSL